MRRKTQRFLINEFWGQSVWCMLRAIEWTFFSATSPRVKCWETQKNSSGLWRVREGSTLHTISGFGDPKLELFFWAARNYWQHRQSFNECLSDRWWAFQLIRAVSYALDNRECLGVRLSWLSSSISFDFLDSTSRRNSRPPAAVKLVSRNLATAHFCDYISQKDLHGSHSRSSFHFLDCRSRRNSRPCLRLPSQKRRALPAERLK